MNEPSATAIHDFNTIAGYTLPQTLLEQKDEGLLSNQAMQPTVKLEDFNQTNMDRTQLTNRFVGSHPQFKTERLDQQTMLNQQQMSQSTQQYYHSQHQEQHQKDRQMPEQMHQLEAAKTTSSSGSRSHVNRMSAM